VTRAESLVPASHTCPARDLKRDEHPVADAAFADVVSNRDHLGHRLMPDRERPGKDAHRRHRLIQITPRDRERSHQCGGGIREPWFRSLLPGDPSSFLEDELAHRQGA
jgi:hypothetical protein